MREAAVLALSMFQNNVASWNKRDGSLVTDADLAVDAFIKSRLLAARPDYGWLSEETPDDQKRLSCQRLWILDPIDGTKSFARGGDEWCIGAALVENCEAVLSVIFRPVVNEFYFASKNAGAFCNDVRLSLGDAATLQGAAMIAAGKSGISLEGSGVLWKPTANLPTLMRFAYVAIGEIDIALAFGEKHDWDVAAGDLLVREAGGLVTNAANTAMRFNQPKASQNGLLAAGQLRHAAVIKYWSEHG